MAFFFFFFSRANDQNWCDSWKYEIEWRSRGGGYSFIFFFFCTFVHFFLQFFSNFFLLSVTDRKTSKNPTAQPPPSVTPRRNFGKSERNGLGAYCMHCRAEILRTCVTAQAVQFTRGEFTVGVCGFSACFCPVSLFI